VPRNLLTYSNDFSNGSWFPYNSSIIPNNYISPNGDLIASKIVESNSLAQHALIKSSTIAIDQPTTFSAYLKINGRNQSQIAIFDSVYTNSFSVLFDLQNGAVISSATSGTGIILNSTITSVGDGWYRCSVTGSISSVTSTNQVIYLAKDFDSFYLGDGVSGILVYGAQLEQGTVATEYFPTTTRLNIPRLDYSNGSCPNLLVEPQRTNLLTYSDDFTNASWTKLNASITQNAIISSDGTLNASKLVENNLTAEHQIIKDNGYFIGSQSFSFYAKAGERNQINLSTEDFGGTSWILNGNGSTIKGGATTVSIKLVTNNWYLCNCTFTSTQPFQFYIKLNNGSGTNYLGNGTSGLYIYGFQSEVGSYPTSYIPTSASTVTRNADVISKTGISSLIGQTEGTIFLDFIPTANDGSDLFSLNLSVDNSVSIGKDGANIKATIFNSGTSFNINGGSYIYGNRYKIALVYKNNNSKVFVNGILKNTNTSNLVFNGVLNNLYNYGTNYYEGNSAFLENSAQLYKTALSDTECIALTTL
jgi:hypothetical protein